MNAGTMLFVIGAIVIAPVMIRIMTSRSSIGSPLFAGIVFAVFTGFSLFTIKQEGVMTVVANHSMNLWGTQVWYDLLISVSLALFFILPRARSRDEAAAVGPVRRCHRQHRASRHGGSAVVAGKEPRRHRQPPG